MIRVKLNRSSEPDGDFELMIDCDLEGLQDLRSAVDELISGRTDHSHLFSGKWGGDHLEPVSSESGGSLHHIKITRVP